MIVTSEEGDEGELLPQATTPAKATVTAKTNTLDFTSEVCAVCDVRIRVR